MTLIVRDSCLCQSDYSTLGSTQNRPTEKVRALYASVPLGPTVTDRVLRTSGVLVKLFTLQIVRPTESIDQSSTVPPRKTRP